MPSGHSYWKTVAASLVLGLGAPIAAHADVISGTSSAYGESVDLTVTALGILGVSVGSGPVPTASGTAPAAYNQANTVLGVNLSGLVPITFGGVLNASASSSVDGTSGTTAASASTTDATIASLISTGVVTANAQISGDFGALTPTGSASIASLDVLGAAVAISTLPNSVLFNSLGIEIVANAQTVTGDSISVDALDITLTNVTLLEGLNLLTINGEIVLDHAEASETAIAGAPPPGTPVPEPGSLTILGAGLLGFAAWRRGRGNQNQTAPATV